MEFKLKKKIDISPLKLHSLFKKYNLQWQQKLTYYLEINLIQYITTCTLKNYKTSLRGIKT